MPACGQSGGLLHLVAVVAFASPDGTALRKKTREPRTGQKSPIVVSSGKQDYVQSKLLEMLAAFRVGSSQVWGAKMLSVSAELTCCGI